MVSADCCGPFEKGQPGTGCSCACEKICPPDCCVGTATFRFECGSPYTEEFTAGCECISAGFLGSLSQYSDVEDAPIDDDEVDYKTPGPLPLSDLPAFDADPDVVSDSDVYAFAACSIPCGNATVRVSAGDGMCCITYEGGSFYAVGGGDLNVSVSGGPDDCLPLTANFPSSVNDGDAINGTLSASGDCCSCCLIEKVDPCSSSFWITRGDKIYLDKKQVLKRVNKIRTYRVKAKLKKIMDSRRR